MTMELELPNVWTIGPFTAVSMSNFGDDHSACDVAYEGGDFFEKLATRREYGAN